MVRAITVFILFFSALPAMAQQWQVSTHHKDKNDLSIRYGREGFGDLNAALRSIDQSKTLLRLDLGRLVEIDSEDLQKDILNDLKQNCPKDLKNALSSAGNMHNPKVMRLHKSFKEALLNTRFIRQIDESLLQHGYRIKNASFEKLILIKKSGSALFDAIVWLEIKRSTHKADGKTASGE